jgi:hypothetical protein
LVTQDLIRDKKQEKPVQILMAEPPPWHTAVCSASLLSLPPELGENVWQALLLRRKDRASLMRASKATQALFSPAVERLTCHLKPDQRSPSGLHKDVQPKRLRIYRTAGRSSSKEMKGPPMQVTSLRCQASHTGAGCNDWS